MIGVAIDWVKGRSSQTRKGGTSFGLTDNYLYSMYGTSFGLTGNYLYSMYNYILIKFSMFRHTLSEILVNKLNRSSLIKYIPNCKEILMSGHIIKQNSCCLAMSWKYCLRRLNVQSGLNKSLYWTAKKRRVKSHVIRKTWKEDSWEAWLLRICFPLLIKTEWFMPRFCLGKVKFSCRTSLRKHNAVPHN